MVFPSVRSGRSNSVCKASLPGFFDELLLFAVEEDGWVRFLEEEQTAYLNQGVGNGGGVKHPSPSGVFSDEAACNRT